jgi:hypothetical protein
MKHHRQWSFVHRCAAAFVLSAGAVACASVEHEPTATRPRGSPTDSSEVVTDAYASSGGSGGSAGSPTLALGDPAPTTTPPETQVCQGETYEGKPIPVDTYFLVDSSVSMSEPVAGGTKWQVLTSALVSYLSAAHADAGAVGVGFFPNAAPPSCMPGDPGCVCIPFTSRCASNTGGSCSPSDYEPTVELSLPSSTQRVLADLAAHQLSGGTPTRPAIEGTLQYLEQWATSHPDRKVALVLATDGEPTGCENNRPEDIARLTGSAWSGPHAIRTFVLGVGALLSSLDPVAVAGGTDGALLVDTSGNLSQELTAALDKIRSESAVSCDFAIPKGDGAANVDPTKVNVRVTTAGGASSLVSQAFDSNPKNCGVDGGWFYDSVVAPTTIKLCESTCRQLQAGSVQIQYGCDTVVRPPR